MLTYWFYPNPGSATYGSPKVMALLVLFVLLLVGSFLVSLWRSRLRNPLTRKLSRTWPAGMRWFGGIALLLIVARVEQVQFLAMRGLWVVWAVAVLAFIVFQYRLWRLRHYSVVTPEEQETDPRLKYLPRRRRH